MRIRGPALDVFVPVTRGQTFPLHKPQEIDLAAQGGQEVPVRHHHIAAITQQINDAAILRPRRVMRFEECERAVSFVEALVVNIGNQILDQRIMGELGVDAVDDAIRKAARGVGLSPQTVVASDAFFPFRDSIDALHAAGIRAVIQPGGSVRDAEVIDACDEYDISMLFTGQRAFLH